MDGKCRLCDQEKNLQESHIIPKFIFSFLKDTSPTGKLRQAKNINLRTQDGIKLHWLCKECEGKFSSWEKYFSEHIFKPMQNGENPINYDENLLKYCVSVSWRVLNLLIENGSLSDFSDEIKLKLKSTMKTWKQFILGLESDIGSHEQHLYNFTGTIEQSTLSISSNIHRYLQRSIAIDVINWGPEAVIVYTKFPGLLLIGFVRLKNLSEFASNKIYPSKGTLDKHQKIDFSKEVWEYIQSKAESLKKTKQDMSNRQKDKISADFKKLPPEEILTSGTIQALEKDIKLLDENQNFNKNEIDDNKSTKK